jgi:hypothetical protein
MRHYQIKPKGKICWSTGKTQYPNQAAARIAMMRVISHDPHANMFDLHTYICPYCSKWHFGHKIYFKKKDDTMSLGAGK